MNQFCYTSRSTAIYFAKTENRFRRDHSFSTYAEIHENSTHPSPMYTNVTIRRPPARTYFSLPPKSIYFIFSSSSNNKIVDNVVYVDKNKWFQFIASRSNMIAYVKFYFIDLLLFSIFCIPFRYYQNGEWGVGSIAFKCIVK